MVLLVLSSLFGTLTTQEPPIIEDMLQCKHLSDEAFQRCVDCKDYRIRGHNRLAYCLNIKGICDADCEVPHYK